MRKFKCCECGHIVTIRWLRKQARQKGYILDYTEPCPECGCPEYQIIRSR